MFEKLSTTQKDIQLHSKNVVAENKEIREKLKVFNYEKLAYIGAIAGITLATILVIVGAIADSDKRELARENELLKKENIYLKQTDVGKLAIENNKLHRENEKQKAELDEYNCIWKACIK